MNRKPSSIVVILLPNGSGVSGGGCGLGLGVETGKTQSDEKAQKTRGPPTVSCTPCWTAGDNGTNFSLRQNSRSGDFAGNSSQPTHLFQLYVELQTNGQEPLKCETEATDKIFQDANEQIKKEMQSSFTTEPTCYEDSLPKRRHCKQEPSCEK